ncbi:hypothetical protein AVEN_19992-1, partial [Araneus ventricosus]
SDAYGISKRSLILAVFSALQHPGNEVFHVILWTSVFMETRISDDHHFEDGLEGERTFLQTNGKRMFQREEERKNVHRNDCLRKIQDGPETATLRELQ